MIIESGSPVKVVDYKKEVRLIGKVYQLIKTFTSIKMFKVS